MGNRLVLLLYYTAFHTTPWTTVDKHIEEVNTAAVSGNHFLLHKHPVCRSLKPAWLTPYIPLPPSSLLERGEHIQPHLCEAHTSRSGLHKFYMLTTWKGIGALVLSSSSPAWLQLLIHTPGQAVILSLVVLSSLGVAVKHMKGNVSCRCTPFIRVGWKRPPTIWNKCVSFSRQSQTCFIYRAEGREGRVGLESQGKSSHLTWLEGLIRIQEEHREDRILGCRHVFQ